MRDQRDVGRVDHGGGAHEAASKLRPRGSLLALAAAAVVLLGCTQDPVGKAPGGLEPSASSQRGERDDASSGSGAQSDDAGGDAGEGDSGGGGS